jgi:hypothetical protein
MSESWVRSVGLAVTVVYASVIVWTYTRQPESFAQFRGGVAASIGAYTVDQQAFADGVSHFRADRFPDARAAFHRADPAERDARTQFYIAYTFYREGWHRLYSDDVLFGQGLKAVEKAVALDPGGQLRVDDVSLKLQTPRELRAELESGLRHEASDLNPLRLFGERK